MITPVRRVVAIVALVVGTSAVGPAVGIGSAEPPPPEPTVPGPTTVLDNDFLPEDANLSDCISALPKPECGSKARGGWRQTAIFAVLAAVLALGGWRLITIIRRRDRDADEEVERIDAARAARRDGERADS